MSTILSTELLSLLHHVELNKSGWWEESVQSFISVAFIQNGNAWMVDSEIIQFLTEKLELQIDQDRIKKQIEVMLSKKMLKYSDGKFNLSITFYSEYSENYQQQLDVENKAKKCFFEISRLIDQQTDPEQLWSEFNNQLLNPLLKESGVKTIEIITGANSHSFEEFSRFTNYLSKYAEKKTKIQEILVKFLNSKDENVHKYLLTRLSAYFFLAATNLDTGTIDHIYSLSKMQTNLKVFVDTNFLLSLLDLHDNPLNDASNSLKTLVNEINKKVNVKFFILPITISEFQNLIKKISERLRELNPQLNQAIALEENPNISGLIKRYYQKCREKNSIIKIDDYFGPYLNNFSSVIRNKGLEIYQVDLSEYETDRKVIDDIDFQINYRFSKSEKEGKFYGWSEEQKENEKSIMHGKFNHDCQIWHYVNDLRPEYIDSIKEVEHWILTLDFNFLEFDRIKLIQMNKKIATCLHPKDFLALLQFWVPRTQKLEDAILGNIQLPLLFKEIDINKEKAIIQILEAISHFENSEDFSPELVAEILTEIALKGKIIQSNSVEVNVQLIQSEILQKYDSLKESHQKVNKENETFRKELKELEQSINENISRSLGRRRNYHIDGMIERKKIQIQEITIRISDKEELINRANKEYIQTRKQIKHRILSIFKGATYLELLRDKIQKKYYNKNEIDLLKLEEASLKKEYDELQELNKNENIIIFCENTDSELLNDLGYQGIYFSPVKNSNEVFIKTRANNTFFGLRDRDFLIDEEINKIRELHPNLQILEYYCLENYLYHPENLNSLGLENFTINEYLNELINQKKNKIKKIILNIKNSRSSYEEFKLPQEKIKQNEEILFEYLESDDIEKFLKAFSLKSEFDKSCLSKYNLNKKKLASTRWFKSRIDKLLESLELSDS